MSQQPPSVPEGLRVLDALLMSGGDTRLHLVPRTLLNGYGCRPFPRPEAFTFASSTATSISARGYRAAAATHAAMRAEEREGGMAVVEALRERLRALLCPGPGHEIVLSPSGTDTALHAAFVATCTLRAPLTVVIAAADETGSGTALAAAGRHFNTVTSRGVAVTKGATVDGLGGPVECVGVALRDARGAARSVADIDGDVQRRVDEARARNHAVLLHAMHCSKLGAAAPSPAALASLRAQGVQVAIDACQMRLPLRALHDHLERGCMVQVTGSKFFTGPPFSGALLVPRELAQRMASVGEVPRGLADYSTAADWPAGWRGIRRALAQEVNAGQCLRWSAALAEMEHYLAAPVSYRTSALRRFAEAVPRILARCGVVELAQPGSAQVDGAEFEAPTIFPFFLHDAGRRLDMADASLVYRGLNADLRDMLGVTTRERDVAATPCHIGQPVAVSDGVRTGGALRISAGARVVSDTWAPDDGIPHALDDELDQVALIAAKLELIVARLPALRAAGAALG